MLIFILGLLLGAIMAVEARKLRHGFQRKVRKLTRKRTVARRRFR